MQSNNQQDKNYRGVANIKTQKPNQTKQAEEEPKNGSISIAKPQNQKKISFTKNNADIIIQKKTETAPTIEISKKTVPTISPPVQSIKVEKKNKAKKLHVQRFFSLEALHEIFIDFDKERHKTSINTLKRSSGYIILKNYIYELKHHDQNKKGSSKPKYTSKPSGPVQFVQLNKERMLPSKMKKQADAWDGKSDDAFKLEFNQTLNKLTASNINEAINIFNRLKKENANNKERIGYMVDTFVEKASKEKAFAQLYSTFTEKCQTFKEEIIRKTIEDFSTVVANPGSDDDEISLSIFLGTGSFFGALSNKGLIENQDIFDSIEELMNKIQNEIKNPKSVKLEHLVEIMKAYFISAGENITKLIHKEKPKIWTKFDEAMKTDGLNKRLYFFFVDVCEKRDEWISGVPIQTKSFTEVSKASDENLAIVRNLYANYQDSGNVEKYSISSSDFISAAMDYLPDQSKAHIHYGNFVALSVSQQNNGKNDDIKNALISSIQRYKNFDIANDCPMIWNMLSDFINQLLLRKVINVNIADELHILYPPCQPYQSENSMKWFLYDYHDFHEPIDIGSGWSYEIRDSLNMPRNIDNPKFNFKVSKLTTISLIRSVLEKLGDDSVNLEHKDFEKYKSFLALALEKQEKTFREEIENNINMYELPYTVDDFCEFCKPK